MRTQLVRQAKAGEETAFTELVDLDGGRAFASGYRILRDVERAQDAVQSAFLLAWRELPRLRDRDRYEVWFHRLLVNACYEEARRERRWSGRIRELPTDGPTAPDLNHVSVEDRDALERAFERLTPEHRAVFVLHHHVGLPLAEIAEIAGARPGTVKSPPPPRDPDAPGCDRSRRDDLRRGGADGMTTMRRSRSRPRRLALCGPGSDLPRRRGRRSWPPSPAPTSVK